MQQEEIELHAQHYQGNTQDSFMQKAKELVPHVDNEVYVKGVMDGLNVAFRMFAENASNPFGFMMVGGNLAAMLAVACDNFVAMQDDEFGTG